MRKFSTLLAAAITVAGVATAAQADIIITAVRTNGVAMAPQAGFTPIGGTAGQLVDVILLKAQNTGSGTGTKIIGFDLTASTAGTTTATNMIFKGLDAVGDGGTTIDTTAQDGSTVQNNQSYGSPSGSFLRYGPSGTGGFVSVYNIVAGHAAPLGDFPENRQDTDANGTTDHDPVPDYTNNHSFEVSGAVLGGLDATTAINIGSIVVPTGTTVLLNGTIGGDFGDTGISVPVAFVSPGGVTTPEPASLSLLALGGLALLARRRKA